MGAAVAVISTVGISVGDAIVGPISIASDSVGEGAIVGIRVGADVAVGLNAIIAVVGVGARVGVLMMESTSTTPPTMIQAQTANAITRIAIVCRCSARRLIGYPIEILYSKTQIPLIAPQ